METSDSILLVERALSPGEAAGMVRDAERRGFRVAPITVGPGRFMMRPDIRNNLRVMWDDEPLAARLWERVRSSLPARTGRWRALGLNERFRVYRYEVGQRFAWHRDGAFQRNAEEQSFYSLLFYLNEGFAGGATEFADRASAPRTGLALAFLHPLRHQGAEVTSGVKYVLRTDVMFRLEGQE